MAIYRYDIAKTASIEDVEALLVHAILATESLHGPSQTRLDAAHFFDLERRQCVIDAGTVVGTDFNRLFIGALQREFGPDAFKVERLQANIPTTPC